MDKIVDFGQFAGRLAGAAERGRWDLLREVQRELGYEEPGGEPLITRRGEAPGFEPGDDVPAALVQWWDWHGNSFTYRPRLYWTHPHWPPSAPEAAGNPSDDEIRVIMSKYQYVHQWGYRASEAEQWPDPPVWVNTSEGWTVQSGSISEFFLQLAVERLPAHFWWTMRVARDRVDGAMVDRLRANYQEMGLPAWREMATDSLSYGGPDVIIRHGRGPGADYALVVHARTRDGLLQALGSLGAEWTDKDVQPPRETPTPVEDLPAFVPAADPRWEVGSTSAALAVPPVPQVTGPEALVDRTALAADRDATVVVAGDAGGHVHFWTVDGSRSCSRHLHHAPVTAVTAHRSGAGVLLWSGDADGVLRNWTGTDVVARIPFARRRTPVTALASAVLQTGPAVAVAWREGLVTLWDVRTEARADLRLGTGIETLALRADAVLHVTTEHGTTELRLDVNALWPDRDFFRRVHEVEWNGLRTNHGRGTEVPALLTTLTTDDEDAAQKAVKRLYELLVSKRAENSAAAAAVPFLVERLLVPTNRAHNTLLLLIADIANGPGAERDAVIAALPSLRHFADEKHPGNIRWAANELITICES
ncbi:hypothetical protein AB0J52_06805 [Spirillospora sp. NPDC049652]